MVVLLPPETGWEYPDGGHQLRQAADRERAPGRFHALLLMVGVAHAGGRRLYLHVHGRRDEDLSQGINLSFLRIPAANRHQLQRALRLLRG